MKEGAPSLALDPESTNAGLRLNGNRAPRGGDSPPEGRWSWTLNWDYMTFDRETELPIENPTEQQLRECTMMIGSCPRSPGDIDRLIDEDFHGLCEIKLVGGQDRESIAFGFGSVPTLIAQAV